MIYSIYLIIYIFVFLLGLSIGSFLNCVIYRLEQKKSLKGRSFCPQCNHELSWQDLFPVFSFLSLRGECRYCHKKISIQYPSVELFTGILFVLIFWSLGFSWSLGFGIRDFIKLCFIFYVSCSMIVIFVYDLKHYIIPDKVLFPAIIITFLYRLIGNWKEPYGEFARWRQMGIGNFATISNFILAALIASGFFLTIFLVSRGRWMGFGDVKLAVLMGLLLGIPNVLVALFLAFFFGAIIGIILMVFPFGSAQGREKKSLKSEIPFGPFLITGTFVSMLCGYWIIQWYLNFFQI